MTRVAIEILSGAASGQRSEFELDAIRIGRAGSNDLVVDDERVAGEHARIVVGVENVSIEDLGSSQGTSVVRGGERIVLGEALPSTQLANGDLVELGGTGDSCAALCVRFELESEHVEFVESRPLSTLGTEPGSPGEATERLRKILAAQRALGAASDLESVVGALAGAALDLVPGATHATVALLEGGGDPSKGLEALTTVATRVRGADGRPQSPDTPIPLTRSIARKVVRERTAVLAADAPRETFSSESLLGANIRSTIGVPLWKGDEILGVLQVDNRAAPGMFHGRDVDSLGVLAADASLAVANARLIGRLVQAEQRLDRENQFLKGRERARSGETRIIGESRAMAELLKQLDKVVDTRVTVLIEGETGTGKELVASALHYRSKRRDKLFVAQNCAAFPENLLESELFGHKRGAFTGATEDKKGLFEVADGGTLFLDELGEMPAGLQAKLLRVLQQGEVRPLGGHQVKQVNVRVVAATNRKLEDEVAAGRFREDLYYRLKVFPIRVPPLRERRDDVARLAQHFLEIAAREMAKPVAGFAQETLAALSAYDWPGNVRELENEVQRLVIQADPGAFLTPDLLSGSVRQVEGLVQKLGATSGTLRDRVEQVERFIVLEVLREHDNNKTSAAKTLGITREGLHKKLKQLGIA
ncbi:MAG TPA: sigma 54-interacting transcriptional regulator [Polyangiaceae bacterium]|nr:sigma 54-interacting transcriptional regulator [Polyangiaceae bacterium]